MTAGDRVRLLTPGNPRIDGAEAVVERVEEWGAHVRTHAAATGRYRALHSEMAPAGGAGEEYSGDVCDLCGSLRLRRNGTCLLCEDCGSTSGCG